MKNNTVALSSYHSLDTTVLILPCKNRRPNLQDLAKCNQFRNKTPKQRYKWHKMHDPIHTSSLSQFKKDY